MLRDLVGEMQRQSGAAAEPDDVDDGIAFGDEELELLVRSDTRPRPPAPVNRRRMAPGTPQRVPMPL